MAEPVYTVASDSETTGEERTSSAPIEIAIGIDIGTMHLRAAIWNGSELEVLGNKKNQKSMECFLSFKPEGSASGLSGNLILEQEMQSGSAIFNLKRLIGRNDKDPIIQTSKFLPFLVQTMDVGVRPIVGALVKNVWRYTTLEEVLAILLVELKSMAEAQFKCNVRSAVLTIPVSFSRFQATRVARACAMAGLHVLRLMSEPTAVALLYAQQLLLAMHDNVIGSGSEKIALVFNMGAGYCDVAVTITSGGVSQIKALAGSAVGGEDILLNTLRHLIPDFDCCFMSGASFKDVKLLASARARVQGAIHALSETSSVEINVDIGDDVVISKTLDRDAFEDVNREVFMKCESLINQCLLDAKVKAEDLADVILVGGCSFIPKLRNLVKGICKKEELYEGIDPLEAAVCGAGLEGAVASGIIDPFGKLELLTIQATPMTIGIQADGRFVPIIPRNTITPARREMVFTTAHDNQAEALIVIYEGEEANIAGNYLLGYFKIGIPKMQRGVPEIKVCMDIDAMNVLRVLTGVTLPGSNVPVGPLMEVRMPNVESGHGWCAEALTRTYGSSFDLMTLHRNTQP